MGNEDTTADERDGCRDYTGGAPATAGGVATTVTGSYEPLSFAGRDWKRLLSCALVIDHISIQGVASLRLTLLFSYCGQRLRLLWLWCTVQLHLYAASLVRTCLLHVQWCVTGLVDLLVDSSCHSLCGKSKFLLLGPSLAEGAALMAGGFSSGKPAKVLVSLVTTITSLGFG